MASFLGTVDTLQFVTTVGRGYNPEDLVDRAPSLASGLPPRDTARRRSSAADRSNVRRFRRAELRSKNLGEHWNRVKERGRAERVTGEGENDDGDGRKKERQRETERQRRKVEGEEERKRRRGGGLGGLDNHSFFEMNLDARNLLVSSLLSSDKCGRCPAMPFRNLCGASLRVGVTEVLQWHRWFGDTFPEFSVHARTALDRLTVTSLF